jgi:hypothetical protein
MLRHLAPVSIVTVLGFAAYAPAGPLLFADLSNDAEKPPAAPLLTATGDPRPTSSGTATFLLNDALTSMTFTATVQNIDFTGAQTPDPNDNLTAAHIHAGPLVTPTTNGPVVWGFFGAPFNDDNPNDEVFTPFTTGVGGTISGKWDQPEGNNTTLDAQLDNLLNNRAYINFHTTQFPGGEIRGNTTVIPLPPALLPGLIGLGMVGASSLWTALRNRNPRPARRARDA